jgi:hypothetical protein
MRNSLIAASLLALTASSASAEMTTFYDRQGRYAGTAITGTGSRTTSFFGSGGRYEGSATKIGRTTTFYDRQGGFAGTAVAPRR